MLIKRSVFIASFCLLLSFAGTSAAASAAAPSQTIEAKIALEASLEKRLLTVLQKALGTDDIIVIVKAELYSTDELEDELMPGVPVQNTPTGGSIALTMLKNLSGVVIVDQSMSQKDLELIERTAPDILGLNKSRGDRITIEKLNMRRGTAAGTAAGAAGAASAAEADTSDFLKPQAIISVLWLVSIVGGLLLIYLSFTRPLISIARDALTHWSSAKEDRPPAPEAPQLAVQKAPTLSNGARHSNGNGHANGAAREKMPFGFITEKNIPMLAHLMRRMTPRTIAVITHYLPARYAAQILVGLKPAKRAEVVRYMSRVTQLQETEVQAIETNIRKKINYLMGGEDQLAAILEEVPAGLQEELLRSLRAKDPDLGRRLGRRIVTLDDLGLLEGDDLKTLSHSVQLKSIAAVLHANENLQRQLMPKLTTGLGQWLTQEIELSQDLPASMLAAEQKAVLAALSHLVHDGVIALHRNEEDFAAGPDAGLMDDEPDDEFDAEMSLDDEPTEHPEPPSSAPPPPDIRDIGTPRASPLNYPEHPQPKQDLGLKPLDPGADILPGPEDAG